MPADPIILEQTLNAPVARVWDALTNPDSMKQWYFDLPGFKAEVGYEFEFYGGKDEHNPYRHLCRVTEVAPGKKIAYTWRYDGYAGNSLVTFELFEKEDKTRLLLTHSGLETFPAENKDLAKENFAAGWNQIIGTSLPGYLEKA